VPVVAIAMKLLYWKGIRKHFFMKRYFWLILTFSVLRSLCVAQVQVSKEPRHHNIFENGHIRLLDVHIPPGDTTMIHVHSTPSVFVILTNKVKVGSQVISEEKLARLNTGDNDNVWFEGFYKQPRIHRVWNSDTAEYHVMDIELTNQNFISIDSPIHQQAFKLLFDEKPVRAYSLSTTNVVNINIPLRKADLLIIRLTDSNSDISVNGKSINKKGDFIYIPSGSPIEIKNRKNGIDRFGVFELK
jgi:hypothetical protein